MAARLTQLQAAMTAAGFTGNSVARIGHDGVERLAAKANLNVARLRALIGGSSSPNSANFAAVADPDEEKRLEAALGVGAGGLR